MPDTCQHCGRRLSPAMRLCPDCGARNPDHVAPVAVATPPARDAYTPAHDAPRAPARPAPAAAPAGHALYPRAELQGRFFASVFDGIVAGLPLVPGTIWLEMTLEHRSLADDLEGLVPAIVLCAVGAVWASWYTLTKDGRPRGQSIGKRMMGIMVVHLPTDAPCTRGQSARRAIVLAATGIIPWVGWLIEPLALLNTEGGRRLGDRVAGTQVIEVADYGPR